MKSYVLKPDEAVGGCQCCAVAYGAHGRTPPRRLTRIVDGRRLCSDHAAMVREGVVVFHAPGVA